MSYTSFKTREEIPESGNVFYNRAPNGLNTCIYGSPKRSGLDVLSNCVGYAHGRFSEIHYLITGKKENICKTLNCNAENFMARAEAAGLEIGSEPRPGAIMCWQKGATLSGSDGAGHVCIVERVNSSTSVLTSESAYGGTAFYNKTRNKGTDGNWGLGGSYKFRAFIYHPDVKEIKQTINSTKETTATPTTSKTYKVGDVVNFKGGYHYVSADGSSGNKAKAGKAKITRIYNLGRSKHPYHLVKVAGSGSNVYGWVDERTFE